MAFIGKLHSLEDRSAVRCSKDVAVNLDIEHAGADKALLRRLVAGAAVRDDGHAVCVSKRTAHDRVAIDRKDVAIRQPKADKLFVGDGLLAVDELLHRHMLLAFPGKSPYFRGGRRHRGTPPSCPSLSSCANEKKGQSLFLIRTMRGVDVRNPFPRQEKVTDPFSRFSHFTMRAQGL